MADEATQTDDRPEGDEVYEPATAGTTNLGPCHYGQEDAATVIATREDGTGWIAICEDHRGDAENDGFSIDEDKQPDLSDEDHPEAREGGHGDSGEDEDKGEDSESDD